MYVTLHLTRFPNFFFFATTGLNTGITVWFLVWLKENFLKCVFHLANRKLNLKLICNSLSKNRLGFSKDK